MSVNFQHRHRTIAEQNRDAGRFGNDDETRRMQREEVAKMRQAESRGMSRLEIGKMFFESGGAKYSQSAQRCECEYRRSQRTAIAISLWMNARERDQMPGLITTDKRNAFLKLDETLRECTKEIAEAEASGNQMLKTLATAEATAALRSQLTDSMMQSVMSLMGSPLGFKTDRDRDGGYTVAQVRDPLIVAMLRGFRPVGNEMNIIAGNFYATKEGMERVLRDYPGFSDLKLKIGVPSLRDGGALVACSATWRLNGEPDAIHCVAAGDTDKTDTRLCIKVNKAMGADAIIGKAKAKLLKRVYEQITGSVQGVSEDIDDSEAGRPLDAEFAVHGEDSSDLPPTLDPATDDEHDMQIAQIIEQQIEAINSASDPELIERIGKTATARLAELGDDGALILAAVRMRLESLTPKGKGKQGTLV